MPRPAYLLLTSSLFGACLVPKSVHEREMDALHQTVEERTEQLEAAQAEAASLTEALVESQAQLELSEAQRATQGAELEATLQALNEPSVDCPADGPQFGEHAWYHADPVYRDWRERTDLGVADVGASYKDPAMAIRLLRAYHDDFPEITRLETIGVTHQGREILALNLTDFSVPDRDKPAVFLNGAHHGHELLGVEYAFDAIDQITQGWSKGDARARSWVQGLDIWVVPVVNPDGLWITTHIHHGHRSESLGGRKNGRSAPSVCANPTQRLGVDLNRNYPYGWGEPGSSGAAWSWNYRGPSAASEPETQAIMALAEREHFLAALTYHTVGPMVIAPYTVGEHSNPEPDVAWAVAEIFAPKGFPVTAAMYPVSGTDQDWLYHEFGTLAYIFEGSAHNPPAASARTAAVERARPAFGDLFDHLLTGPRVSGFVTDASGDPVRAVIEIEGYQTFHGERWTTRADGRFDRMVMEPGDYRVTATREDGVVSTHTIQTGGAPSSLVLGLLSP